MTEHTNVPKLEYEYIYKHEDYGVLEVSIVNEDMYVIAGDFVKLNGRLGSEFYRVTKTTKIIDDSRKMITYILYLVTDNSIAKEMD